MRLDYLNGQVLSADEAVEFGDSPVAREEFKRAIGEGLWVESKEGKQRVMLRAQGGVALASVASPIINPIAGPTFPTVTEIRVDVALKDPTRVITPMIIDLTLLRFFVDRLLTNAGGVTGGAVVYNEVEANDVFADRDVAEIAPGAEYPIVQFTRRGFKVAPVRKWGGRFYYTWEARDRNDVTLFTNGVRQLSNTIVRKVNQAAVALVDAAITAGSRTASGVSWSTVVTTGSSASNHTLWPAHDFGKLDLVAEQEELGMSYNLLIMNPLDYFNLKSIYGKDFNDLLASFGKSIFVTNRVAAGALYAAAEGQAGEMRLEQPLSTRTYPDANGIDQDWIQSGVRPVMFINNAFALLKLTGIA